MSSWEKIDQEIIWHPFSPLAGNKPIYVKKARGLYLHTESGRRIMDVISSWWVNVHGHAHPKIAKAIARQAARLEQVIFAGFTHKPAIKLSKTLIELLPTQTKVFFSDNGSTSTEVALKLAIQYWYNKGKKRKKIIAIEGAYHGDTFGAMSLGGKNTFTHPFIDYMFDVEFLPFPHGDGSPTLEAMKQAVKGQEAAAFIFEPLVQGAGGMRMYAAEVLDGLVRIARENEVITIADEVMTGFGRTGKMFACDYLKNKPDIYCLSKGVTGGFLPLGLTLVNAKIADAFDSKDKEKAFFHGHSYTANPLACAAANASMKLLRKNKVQKAIDMISRKQAAFVATIEVNDKIADARSQGTIMAIELSSNDPGYTSSIKERIYDHFMARDILLRPLGNVIYMIPPFIITEEELDHVYTEIMGFLAAL